MANNSGSIEDLLSKGSKNKLQGTTTPATPKKEDDTATGNVLTKKLTDIQFSEDERKIQTKATALGVPYIDLTEFPISAEALEMIPENVCIETRLVCFLFTGEQIRLATTNPENPKITAIKDSLADTHHAKVEIYMISERNLTNALNQYAKLPKYTKRTSNVNVAASELDKFKDIGNDFKALGEYIKKVNTTELMTLIIAAAIGADASDIHIEAEEKNVKVRLRVDGLLHDAASLDNALWPKIISRIKLLSGLKINISDKPQDGRFSIDLTEGKMDVRVSCTPTAYGESVVMRLLKSSSASLKFEDLGLTGQSFEDLKQQTERPNGMIITTGPTGSGKTTTLYAILNKLNTEDIKICTLEDPIEYKLKGINQSQIDHSKNYSFADGLRSLLRQDPDVVMIGEMRDLETAETAVNAALTGHLVVSTIHTNDAAGAIPRFVALGVKPFLLAPAMNAIMGQRLVRKVCNECKEELELPPDMKERALKLLNEIPENHPDRPDLTNLKFYHGKGCPVCHQLGFKGRIGIYEIMIITPPMEKMINTENITSDEIQQEAIKNGMITMVQDGLIKASKGITSVDEVFRVSE
jgi:type IV pilus assembly protein PilB